MLSPLAESPGTIALATGEIGRFTMFTVSLASTRQPVGSNLAIRASANVTENFNDILRDLRDEDEWVWIMGDDHVWPGDCLMLLLETMDDHPEIDILVPLVVKRNPPWSLVVFHKADIHEDGMQGWMPFRWDEIPEHGVFEVDAAGSAGMLIRRHVVESMSDPWFESTHPSILNEDVTFCNKARENHGFRVFATANVTMGHLGIFNVRPMYRDGRWGAMAEFSSAEEQFRHLFMPSIEDFDEVTSGRS